LVGPEIGDTWYNFWLFGLVGHPGISIFSIVLAVWSTKEDPDVLDDFSKKNA